MYTFSTPVSLNLRSRSFLDIFPDRISCRTDDHTSLYRGIIDQFRLFTTSVYHCAKSTSIDVIASTNFLLSFAIIYLLFIALTAVASSFKGCLCAGSCTTNDFYDKWKGLSISNARFLRVFGCLNPILYEQRQSGSPDSFIFSLKLYFRSPTIGIPAALKPRRKALPSLLPAYCFLQPPTYWFCRHAEDNL